MSVIIGTANILLFKDGAKYRNRQVYTPLGNSLLDACEDVWQDKKMDAFIKTIPNVPALREVFLVDENERNMRQERYLSYIFADCDFVCLQEVDPKQIGRLAKALNMPKCVMNTERGCALFARDSANIINADSLMPNAVFMYDATRQLAVVCVHNQGFDPNNIDEMTQSINQIESYAKRMREAGYPSVVIVGDFNIRAGYNPEDLMLKSQMARQGFTEPAVAKGPTATESCTRFFRPNYITIDRCFVRNVENDVVSVDYSDKLGPTNPHSDHTPLIIKINNKK